MAFNLKRGVWSIHWHPWNLALINNVEVNVVFLGLKLFNSDIFFIVFYSRIALSLLDRNHNWIYSVLKWLTHEYLIDSLADKAFNLKCLLSRKGHLTWRLQCLWSFFFEPTGYLPFFREKNCQGDVKKWGGKEGDFTRFPRIF